jgi:hypothetical protein
MNIPRKTAGKTCRYCARGVGKSIFLQRGEVKSRNIIDNQEK